MLKKEINVTDSFGLIKVKIPETKVFVGAKDINELENFQ